MSDAPVNSQMEAEANYFAMCLLMPEELMKNEVEKIPKGLGIEAQVQHLAKRFAVSPEIMSIRLGQLGALKGVGL